MFTLNRFSCERAINIDEYSVWITDITFSKPFFYHTNADMELIRIRKALLNRLK